MTFVTFRAWAAALALTCLATAAGAASISNGSLTGPIDNDGVPPGWTIQAGSPDTNDVANNVGTAALPFGVAPTGPSPDGGTWVGIAADATSGFIERFGQSVSAFSVGQSYTLSWYMGNFGEGSGLGYTGANAIEVLLDGVSIGSGTTRAMGSSWFAESLMFTASAATHDIAFQPAGPARSYISIDGIALTSAVIPLPAPALLLGSAVLCFAALRRRAARRAA
jgi:hypothetical protein